LAGLVVPVVLILFMGNTWVYMPASGLGTLVMLMLLSSNLLASLVLEDRIDGSIMKVLTSPTTMTRYVFQNLLAAMIPLVLQIALLGMLGPLRYDWTGIFTIGVVVTLFICTITITAFSFCWNMYFTNKNSSKYAFLLFMALVLLLSGLMIPMEALPGWLRHVGAILHPYWFVRAVLILVDDGMTAQFWLYNVIVLLFGVGFILLGGRRRRM